jgi:hypothetical protein
MGRGFDSRDFNGRRIQLAEAFKSGGFNERWL